MKMKISTLLLAFALLGSSAMLSSCKKNDDNNGSNSNTPAKDNSLTAIIGTKIVDPSGLPTISYEADKGILTATVYDKDQVTTLALTMQLDQGNTLAFGSTAFGNVQTSSNTDGLYEAVDGNVNLSTNDRTNRIAEGTFSFSAQNLNSAKINVTSGKFYIKY
ncbi:MAG: hypothetical protein GC180_08465 [Bacteroidetes bacterium]|nr:hypothetical protein [Bacteroidota bacterium]